MNTALLLIAHGSRRDEANADLEYMAQELRRRGPYSIIEGGYLELAMPTIASAAAECVRQGADRVLMVPFFLSAGIHVTEDLRDVCRQLGETHSGVEFRLCEPMGRHLLLVEILVQRAQEGEL